MNKYDVSVERDYIGSMTIWTVGVEERYGRTKIKTQHTTFDDAFTALTEQLKLLFKIGEEEEKIEEKKRAERERLESENESQEADAA